MQPVELVPLGGRRGSLFSPSRLSLARLPSLRFASSVHSRPLLLSTGSFTSLPPPCDCFLDGVERLAFSIASRAESWSSRRMQSNGALSLSSWDRTRFDEIPVRFPWRGYAAVPLILPSFLDVRLVDSCRFQASAFDRFCPDDDSRFLAFSVYLFRICVG